MRFIDKTTRNIIASLGERLAKEALEKEGYTVENFKHCGSEVCVECGVIRGKFRLWGDWEYPDECKRGDNWIILMKRRDELEPTRGYNLDFYTKKNGKECIIEVKTNTGQLVESQRKLLEFAKELGYIPIIVRSEVDITGEVIEIKEL